jgi:hypothetical protein
VSGRLLTLRLDLEGSLTSNHHVLDLLENHSWTAATRIF